MPHDHHDHDHPHSLLPSDPAVRVKALETILVNKGLVDPAAMEAILETYEKKVGPHLGAQVVARAWADSGFRAKLMADANAAMADLGISGRQGEHVVGQLYEVDASALARMDVLERITKPDWYSRAEIAVRPCADAQAPVQRAWVYFGSASRLKNEVVHLGPLAEYTLAHAAMRVNATR